MAKIISDYFTSIKKLEQEKNAMVPDLVTKEVTQEEIEASAKLLGDNVLLNFHTYIEDRIFAIGCRNVYVKCPKDIATKFLESWDLMIQNDMMLTSIDGVACRQKLSNIGVTITNYIETSDSKKCSNSCSIYEEEFQNLKVDGDQDIYCIDETDFFESLTGDILPMIMWRIQEKNTSDNFNKEKDKDMRKKSHCKLSLVLDDKKVIHTTSLMNTDLAVNNFLGRHSIDLSYGENITAGEKLSIINEMADMLRCAAEYENAPKKIILSEYN